MSSEFWILYLFSFLTMSGVMAVTFWVARKINNYSIVDAVWALSFFLIAILILCLAPTFFFRKFLILGTLGVWSLRLGIFLTRRIASHHPEEDRRYLELRKSYGEKVATGFFWFFQYQAWSIAILAAPLLVMAQNPHPEISRLEFYGIIFFYAALLGEAISDGQANQFKKDPKNKGKVCEVGLWKYSRHPNYFFESLIWWSFYAMACGSPGGGYTVFAPLIMLFLLLKVTGVPMAEKQSLLSRGDAYRTYQARTSSFVPWFPKD